MEYDKSAEDKKQEAIHEIGHVLLVPGMEGRVHTYFAIPVRLSNICVHPLSTYEIKALQTLRNRGAKLSGYL